jgi:sulfotransferase family protein
MTAVADARSRPIVVCGPARSGTTMVRAMLNSHANILIAGEVPLYAMPSLAPLLEETAKHQRSDWTEQRRAEVVRALWFATSRPVPYRPAARWGMKTPWSELDSDFWGSMVSPLYVYALRRGDRVFQSHIRLGWGGKSPGPLIRRYKESLKAFEKLRREGSAHIVQLDLLDGPESRRRAAEEMFAFVGEDPEEDKLQQFEGWRRRLNQPTSEPGEEPELPDEWQEHLASDGEYHELMAALGY